MQQWIQDTLQEKIIDTRPLTGGDIADSLILSTPTTTVVVKTYDNPEVVESELLGLRTIEQTNSFQVPLVLSQTSKSIMMSYVEHAEPLEVYWLRFAKSLFKMHQNTSDTFGFHQATYCGRTKLPNHEEKNWSDFFIKHRLLFLIEKIGDPNIQRAFEEKQNAITEILDQVKEPPSLVHGDLWGGNHICDQSQAPYVIDPAVYYGHRETDLAMMKLFGGFPDTTFRVYNELYPLDDGWEKRENIYQLFHILNHAYLFGGHYIQGSISRLNKI